MSRDSPYPITAQFLHLRCAIGSIKTRNRLFAWLGLALLNTCIFAHDALASDTQDRDELRMVVVLSRHGVRSPTAEAKTLDAFSDQAWPHWSVAPGYLTAHGKQLMSLMGAWYRAYYAQAGLLSSNGCKDISSTYVIADDEQRTLESAHGLMDGFAPGCAVTVNASAKDRADGLFGHRFADASSADRDLALAAVRGRVGDAPDRLTFAHAAALASMQSVLLGCAADKCSAAQTAGKKILIEQPNSIEPGQADALVSIKSPLHNASTFAENFVLEYSEGLPMSQVAWGRVSAQQVGQLLQLHSAYSDIALRTPAIARAYAGKLAMRILATLRQGVLDKPVDTAIGKPGTRFVLLLGHDTNITTVAGLLNLHWMLDEQPTDPTSTGGALVFELRRDKTTRADRVRVYYVSQSMEQMRMSTPLSLDMPAQRAPIFVPACSASTPGYDCPFDQFANAVTNAAGTQAADAARRNGGK